MNKRFAIALLLIFALSLTACGGGKSAPAPTQAPPQPPTQAPAAPEVTPVPAQNEPTAAPAVTEASAPADDTAEKAKALVLSMKDQPIDDLLAELEKLGLQYKSRDYFSSCLIQGGQDGTLEYEGFTVYTLVQPDGTETVYDVE